MRKLPQPIIIHQLSHQHWTDQCACSYPNPCSCTFRRIPTRPKMTLDDYLHGRNGQAMSNYPGDCHRHRQHCVSSRKRVRREAGFAGADAVVLRPPASVTAGHPTGFPNTFVGLYPYQIMPNAQWRNASLPNRRSDWHTGSANRSAYDVYFVLTCYGDDSQLEPQRVLGGALLASVDRRTSLDQADDKNATSGLPSRRK